jgi:hypothetical protein
MKQQIITNRDKNRDPKLGLLWCPSCDRYRVGYGQRCPVCGKRRLPRRYKP